MTQEQDNRLLLAIDNGTQSVRALLFDLRGECVAISQVPLQAYYSDQPGWAEQRCEYFWQQLCKATQQLWIDSGVDKRRVAGVSLTTQRNTVVNLDAAGQPLRPAMIWLDQRLAEIQQPLPWHWRALFAALGQSASIDYFRRKAQANWIAQNQAEIWGKTAHFVFLSGYLNHKLCGEFRDSVASTVGYVPFDYKKQRWAGTHDWKWAALPIRREQLPELIKPGERLGLISNEAAEDTGIPAGLPLLAAASDKACEVLGSGCHRPHQASLSFGTTATVNSNNEKYVEPLRFVPPYPSAIPDQYNTEAMIFRGFWMVSWFKQEFGLHERKRAEKLGVSAESLFDDLVNSVPPGSMGLVLQPHWSPGLKNLHAKGAILGFGDVHTRAHMYRSILEGLCYGLKEGAERIERQQRQAFTALRVSGGGSQSDAAMQISADVFNLPAERPHTHETSGLGAAINAAVGLGLQRDYPGAIAAMTRTRAVFEPRPEQVELYRRLYRDVYLQLEARLKPVYRRIRDITGYPE